MSLSINKKAYTELIEQDLEVINKNCKDSPEVDHIRLVLCNSIDMHYPEKKLLGKFKIITLCGSTKFKEHFLSEQKRLTLEGNIVISVGLFGHSGDDEVWLEDTKQMLDDMHKRKIDLADEIFVINVSGYIGSSTKSEIEYAYQTGKSVNYLVAPIN